MLGDERWRPAVRSRSRRGRRHDREVGRRHDREVGRRHDQR